MIRRLRSWAGPAFTVLAALIEHWAGETAAVALLTVAVVIFGGILWRRVSILMATGGSTNCAKAYAVDDRLSNYMTLMAPVAGGNFNGVAITCKTLTSTGDITAGANLGVDGGTVFWPGGVAINTGAASTLSELAGGTFDQTLTVMGSIGIHGNVNYTGSLNGAMPPGW